MVRNIQVKLLEDEVSRQITYAKRRNGLIKKAFEISVLSDVDVAFIAFSPTGRLSHFSGNKRIEDVLARFVNLPEHIRKYPIENQEYLVQVLNQLKLQTEEDTCHNQILDIQGEILQLRERLQIAEADLRNYEPIPEYIMSANEAEERGEFLGETLERLTDRESELLGEINDPPQMPNASEPIEKPKSLGDKGSSSSSSDEVNRPPPNEIDSDQISKESEPSITHKPEASRFNDLVDQGKELLIVQTLQEVPNTYPIDNGTSGPPIANSPHLHQVGMSSSNPPPAGSIPHSHPITMELIPQNGGLRTLDNEQEANLIRENKHDNPRQNVQQMEGLLPSRCQQAGLYEILNQEMALPVNSQLHNIPNVYANNNTYLGNGSYHLPISNLPPEHRLSTTHQGPQIPSFYTQNITQLGSRDGGIPFYNLGQANRFPQNQSIPFEPLYPSRPQNFPFDQHLNQVPVMSNMLDPQHRNYMQLDPSMASRPQEIQFSGLLDQTTNMPIQQQGLHRPDMRTTVTNELGESSSGRSKRKLVWQDGIPTMLNSQEVDWFSQVQNSQGQTSNVHDPFNLRYAGLSVYDPMYERMGLPVDPHLRMFAARRRLGNDNAQRE